MAQIQTSNFLPDAFRTDANKKFLNATLDQLVTQPDLRNINGYVGRKFAPTFKSTDNYVPEPTVQRQNYQLEPSVVVKNKITGNTEFFSSYIDYLNQIGHYGGLTNNHSRLFGNESYSFNGLFDFDKFINFTQYYWLENGPDAVAVFGSEIPTQETFIVTRNPSTGTYQFTGSDGVSNPTLRLAYGGTYQFVVNQPGYPFWIQTDPGLSGKKVNQSNLNSRDVLGVTNNGLDVGTVVFQVPQPTAQDFYTRMPLAGSVDLSTTLHYNQIQGQRLSSIKALAENGIDGVFSQSQLNLKSLIFVNNDVDPSLWTANNYTVPVAQRLNAWIISLSSDSDPIVTLSTSNQAFSVTALNRVFVKSGTTRAEYTYYTNADYLNYNVYYLMPDITSVLNTLYYQDGVGTTFVGEINLLQVNDTTINIDTDIVGKTTYQSPNGVLFSNGLKVTFTGTVNPSTYYNNSYYVEGVGTAIKLLPVSDFLTPESYASSGLVNPDYFTINRASIDLNAWTRSNRWFHIDIINSTAAYNGTTAIIDQAVRANRPIIEFEADLQLFQSGRVAKTPVDLLNTTANFDSKNTIELAPQGTSLDGTVITDGMRIIFANDLDPTVRGQIFVANIVYIPSLSGHYINLTLAADSVVELNHNVVVLQGPNKGTEFHYTYSNGGLVWVANGQQKTKVNQAPLFDVVDSNGVSISTYLNSTFAGTQIFGYKVGTGAVDPVLGIALSYRNFNQIGDIQFVNNFDSDTFGYTTAAGTAETNQAVNTVGTLQQNIDLTSFDIRNTWTTNVEKSKQFQIIAGVYDGNNPYFKIDIAANSAGTVPNFRVYRNSKQITGYELVTIGVLQYVHVTDSALTTGDQIDILIYSDAVSALGYYEVPKNLDFNSENANFVNLTLGQLRNHLTTMVGNSSKVFGAVPGNSNLRDVPVKQQGGSILQHSSPVVYGEMFLVDPNANFMSGVELARYEYSKVKNKILELSTRTNGLDYTNVPALLDTLLQNINSVKNKTFAWYYSDMVPYGTLKNTLTYTVVNAEIVDYEISNVFSDTTLGNTAVLVYKNNVQLVKGVDYKFDTNRAGVTVLTSLAVGDVLTINEYSSTDGNYIPETPTKLGLYPKFTPNIYLDTTYQTPIMVIQGHDGSITPAFGDYRDQLLLEFELRIYNNIKVDYSKNVFDIYNYLPGKFRTTDYTNNEFTQLLTNSFLRWSGSNRVDYITNSYFVANAPFTWNYNRFVDTINGEALAGYWRGIYKYFYDTDRPHTNPWEMLGFSEQPSWWETRYGPAPYTGGNLVLWGDLAAGYIWNGGNGNDYTDTRFARPNLLSIIPVDSSGNLRSPEQFAVKSFNSNNASGNYKIGDQGPVESAWRRSSDFPFAMQQALALSHPAFYFGSLIDIGRYYKNTGLDQYVLADTLQRVTPGAIRINGTTSGTTVYRSAGYLNWIAEYLRNQGIDPGTKLYEYLDNVNIQLAYKMAGYTDQSFIQVIAEQSSPTSTNSGVVIPNESYAIELYKSTPTNRLVYSGVVIERTASGYSVSGFDFETPYFTIIPSLANNNSYSISVLNESAVIYSDFQTYKVTVPYGYEFTSKQQVVDFLVSYQRYLQGSGFQFTDVDPDLGIQRDWILSAKEFLTWSQQGWKTSSVLVLSPTLDRITLTTAIGVVDKIQNTPISSKILDTNYNYIKYSQLTVNRQALAAGNTFNVQANSGQTIALAVLDVVEYEHIMIFNNTDVFNDIIYVPELGNRQYRLKLIGKKTGSWSGALNPSGFIYNSTTIDTWQPDTDYAFGSLVQYKNNYYTATQNIAGATTFNTTLWSQVKKSTLKTGLLPNFSYNAEKFNRFNDIDNPESLGNFDAYSDSAIGFRSRSYLTNFGIDNVTQAKFYQGYIREKGTLNAITAFTAAGFNSISSNISLYEEWGMRVGEYGALDNNRSIELILTESTFNGDPVTITLLPNGGSTSSNGIIGVQTSQLYKHDSKYTPNIYINRDASSIYENDLPTAGYVNINDVDATIYDIANYSQLSANIADIGIGYKIWCAKDINSTWNVYRVTETDISVTKIVYSVDNIGVVTTNGPHQFAYGDLIAIKNFDVRVNGVYQVYSVIDPYNFNVVFSGQAGEQIKQAITITGTGTLFTFESQRIANSTDINSLTPAHGWIDNDKLWVDNNNNGNTWAVYNKSTPWTGNVSFLNPSMRINGNSYISNSGFGTVVAINSSGTFAAAGLPKLNLGNVAVFVANVTNGNVLTQVGNIGAHTGNSVSNFGASLATAGNLLYIGDPGNGTSDYGRVHIHQFNGNASFPWTQTLSSPWGSNTGDAYGTSVAASADGTWLYVSAPNAGNVYVYHANATSYYSYANTVTVGSSTYAQFGYTVGTTSDGRQIAIGAPYDTVNGISAAGAVYVYDRSVESFVATGSTSYTTSYPAYAANVKITVNGNVLSGGYTVNGTTTVTFANAPVIGSLITIDTNKIQLLERLVSPAPSSGAAFGAVTSIAGNDADIYVSSPGYSTVGYHSGIVYRFVNQGAAYGTITGTKFAPNVTVGDSIRINGFNVTFTGNTAANVATNINSANIPGVTALAQDFGALTITSNITTPYQKLVIGAGPGTAVSDLGLQVYNNSQSLLHPATDIVDQFGSQILSSPDSKSLVISADQGSTYNLVTFDNAMTTFDQDGTTFFDVVLGSGVVYIYGLVGGHFTANTPDQYTLVQRLQNNSLNSNDQFGYTMAMNAKTLLVGAPGASGNLSVDPVSGAYVPTPNSGTFYTYNNFGGNIGWDVISYQLPQVDIDSISRMYLYNSNTASLVSSLDYIDPAKGKVLGVAQADLDFITAYDPAVYNAVSGIDSTPNLANSQDFHWGPAQVTKTWWNTDAVRYLDYEQGNVTYRANNWGRVFPGSTIQVCEWVESAMPPSAYTGTGTPLYPDNTAYSISVSINPNTGMATSTYYYWVVGKTSLEQQSVHTNTVSTIADMIANPQAQGIPYAAVLRSDSVSLYGISNLLSGNSVVLHSDYDVLKNTNIIHSEYQLVQEGNSNSPIPARIINKIVDSLSGVDSLGNTVPDATLAPQTRIGLGERPNQTLFVDRAAALESFVEYVNDILIQYPIVEEFNINNLYSAESVPDTTQYDVEVATYAELSYIDTTIINTGYTALVLSDETRNYFWSLYSWSGTGWSFVKSQSYNTTQYWSKVNWYDSTYDPTVLPTYTVATVDKLSLLSPAVGDTIKVLNNGNGQFVVYRVNSDGTSSLVGIENGTIQFSSILYTGNVSGQEIRVIFETIQNDIFVDTLKVNFNDLFFFLINYILSEQPSVDWVFKTSFVSILHKLRKLEQFPNYIQDNQTYYEQYINEVKPYRTSLREYLIAYQGNDEYYGDMTDFDIPSTYITSVGGYRSPNGSNVTDAASLSTLPQYSQWYKNHSYSISSVVVSNPGQASNVQITTLNLGFAPNIGSSIAHVEVGDTITQPNSGASGVVYTRNVIDDNIVLINVSGTFVGNVTGNDTVAGVGNTYLFRNGANLTANVATVSTNYAVTGYYTVPTVTVVGGGGSGANIIAQLDGQGGIASFEVISPGQGYTSTPTLFINGTGTGAAGYPLLSNKYYIENLPTTTLTANSNVMAYVGNLITQPNTGAYGTVYSASSGNIITLTGVVGTFASNQYIYSDAANLNTYVTLTNSYTQFINQSYNTVRTFATTINFDRVNYSSNVIAWQPNIAIQANSWVSYNGAAYQAQGNVYSTAVLSLSGNIASNVGDYITQSNSSGNARVLLSNVTAITLGNISGAFLRRGGNLLINNIDSGVHPMAVNNIFDYTKYTQLNANAFASAADRITAYYQPTVSMPGKDLSQLMSGISYPGVVVAGPKFAANTLSLTSGNVFAFANNGYVYSGNTSVVNFANLKIVAGQPLTIVDNTQNKTYYVNIIEAAAGNLFVSNLTSNIASGANVTLKYYDYNNPLFLDSIITNTYTNTAFGTSPADITVDGGAYFDTYSSHGPEELIPGTMYDNLNMEVFTRSIFAANGNVDPNGTTVGIRVTANMSQSFSYHRISSANTTVLSANLNLTDSNIHVTNASVLPVPDLTYLHPGIIYINGEKITYWTIDTVNNVLGQIRRAVDGTGAANVHVSGSRVVDSSFQQSILSNIAANTWISPWSVGNVTAANVSATFGNSTIVNSFLIASPSYTP